MQRHAPHMLTAHKGVSLSARLGCTSFLTRNWTGRSEPLAMKARAQPLGEGVGARRATRNKLRIGHAVMQKAKALAKAEA
eukprot:182049-Chlamydomonas_euryale.AAC.1